MQNQNKQTPELDLELVETKPERSKLDIVVEKLIFINNYLAEFKEKKKHP